MNRVELIGNAASKPELNDRGEVSITRFTIAVNKRNKDKGADFIRIVAFGKEAENICRYVDKGRQIAIEGRIQTGSYEKDGRTNYTFEVICDHCEFLGRQAEPRSTDRSYHTYDGYSDPPQDYRRYEEPLF